MTVAAVMTVTTPLPAPVTVGWSPDHRRGHLGDLDRPARYRYRAGWVRRIHDLRRTGPPTVDALQFPATQNYDNGTVIRWDEPTSEGGRETLHPVPALTITRTGRRDR